MHHYFYYYCSSCILKIWELQSCILKTKSNHLVPIKPLQQFNMSSPLEMLENIEHEYANNKKDNQILQHLLSLLEMHSQSIEYVEFRVLINSMKTSILRQQMENRNYVIDGWKNHLHHSNSDGHSNSLARPRMRIDRDMLMCLISIGLSNSEIARIFKAHQNTVMRCIEESNLNNLLQNPEDNNIIAQHFLEYLEMCPNMGELHARGALLSKGIKINRLRLRNLLKNLKQSAPLNANPIRRRTCKTRTSNSM